MSCRPAILLFLVLPCAIIAHADERRRRPEKISIPHFAHGFPRSVSVADIQRLVQKMVTATYRTGFRQPGVDVDFSHGHIIFSPRYCRKPAPPRSEDNRIKHVDRDFPLEPLAILYHTQERAGDAERAKDYKYGYIDPLKRNWLQHWETGEVDDASRWVWPGVKVEEKNDYCIGEEHLDWNRLGAATRTVSTGTSAAEKWLAKTFQFNFHGVDPKQVSGPRNDQFTVKLPNGEQVLLRLSSDMTRRLENPYRRR